MLLLALGLTVFDFTTDPTWTRASTDEEKLIEKRFPHPHAGGKPCKLTDGGGGRLLPTITKAGKAFMIDYCPIGGRGIPRTRRFLVLDGDKVTTDYEFGKDLMIDEVLSVVDLEGDGKPEYVMTGTVMRRGRSVVVAYVVRPEKSNVKVLGTWTAKEHCVPGRYEDEIVHVVTWDNGKFVDASKTQHCYYPP